MNSNDLGGLKKLYLKISRNCNLTNLLVPETMFPLHVQREVCIAPFYVRSKACTASIHVRRKLADFGPHMD